MMESRLSALVDGELEQDEAVALLASIKGQQELQDEWMLLHLIGDTLRRAPPLSPGFNARFAERLAKEPTVLAPRTNSQESQPGLQSGKWAARRRPLIALSAAASIAAVSLVAWSAFQFNREPEGANIVVAENSLNSAVSAANVNSYLAAHQEYSHVAQDSGSYQRAAFRTQQDGGR